MSIGESQIESPTHSASVRVGSQDEPTVTRDLQQILEYQASYSHLQNDAMQQRESVVRHRLPARLKKLLGNSGWSVEGKGNMGKYSKVPWLRIYRSGDSPSAQIGWYVVFLFAADGSKVYLSLNQGTRNIDGTSNAPKDLKYLRQRVTMAREMAASAIKTAGANFEAIDLGQDLGTAASYDQGNVASICYELNSIPDEAAILADLNKMLDALEVLYGVGVNSEPGQAKETDGLRLAKVHDLAWLQSQCLWDMSALQELASTFRTRRPQLILAGPPGTSKTWIAENLALYIVKGDKSRIYTVQFHPSYSYEDFIEGVRPRSDKDGHIVFDPVAGVLLKAAAHAASDSEPVVLVIDELNRTNLSSVFGELFYLLEYRDRNIDLRHSTDFSLPNNLCFIATMNTVDRNIRSIDLALRRRFDIVECSPQARVIERYYSRPEHDTDISDLVIGFERLNSDLQQELDRHHTIGHTYFMHPTFDAEQLRLTWTRQIGPLLEEYFFLDPEKHETFSIGKYWTHGGT